MSERDQPHADEHAAGHPCRPGQGRVDARDEPRRHPAPGDRGEHLTPQPEGEDGVHHPDQCQPEAGGKDEVQAGM